MQEHSMKKDNILGYLTDIETMGLVDGPGMRLVLFLAGCPLRCLYCHNPETWELKNYTQTVTSDDVLKLYQQFGMYYGESGGVTFSGGEPLSQSQFVLECAKLLKEHKIHTALDTSGASCGDFDELLDYIDLVILDIKAVDEDEYKKICGKTPENFNKFLSLCQKKNKKLWLRQVIVPNINDDIPHIQKLANYIKNIKNVEKVELLPYHSMAKSKYEKLNIPYRLQSTPDMDKQKCSELEKILRQSIK